MKVYIAASWKHQHAVSMFTHLLRQHDHVVFSFVENSFLEEYKPDSDFSFEKWLLTESANQCFKYDTTSARDCDICVYISPSGKDAAAEVGIAYANRKYIIGLWAKGEDFGLMRKMIHTWCDRYEDVIKLINTAQHAKEANIGKGFYDQSN